jgi:hypothetical protein
MDKDHESKMKELGDRLKLGLKYSAPRFGIPHFRTPEKRFEWMMKEHEEFRDRTNACLEYWMARTDFESHEDEEPIRQAHWRLLAAADWLSIGAAVILDHEPDRTPDEILRQMLFDSWLPDSNFPAESFENFAEGRTMFQRD